MKPTYSAVTLLILGTVVWSACSPVLRIPDEPVYNGAVTQSTSSVSMPVSAQTAKVVLRMTPEGDYEARLTQRLLCQETRFESQGGYRTVRHELSSEDNILMWTGLGGAGLTAVLVTIGLAREKDPGRGAMIFGLYGVPLAALGGYEWWRSRPVTEPVKKDTVRKQVDPSLCPRELDSLKVDIYGNTVTALASPVLTPMWRPVTIAMDKTSAIDSRTVIPIVLKDGAAGVYLPLNMATNEVTGVVSIVSARSESPAPVSATVPAPVAVTAPVAAAAPSVDAVCKPLGLKAPTVGWLPTAFYKQATTKKKIAKGKPLSSLIDGALVWQVYELNRDFPKQPEDVYTGKPRSLKVPKSPKLSEIWKEQLPLDCR